MPSESVERFEGEGDLFEGSLDLGRALYELRYEDGLLRGTVRPIPGSPTEVDDLFDRQTDLTLHLVDGHRFTFRFHGPDGETKPGRLERQG